MVREPSKITAKRKRAMLAFVGIRKDRPDMADPESYIRELREGKRLERLGKTKRHSLPAYDHILRASSVMPA